MRHKLGTRADGKVFRRGSRYPCPTGRKRSGARAAGVRPGSDRRIAEQRDRVAPSVRSHSSTSRGSRSRRKRPIEACASGVVRCSLHTRQRLARRSPASAPPRRRSRRAPRYSSRAGERRRRLEHQVLVAHEVRALAAPRPALGDRLDASPELLADPALRVRGRRALAALAVGGQHRASTSRGSRTSTTSRRLGIQLPRKVRHDVVAQLLREVRGAGAGPPPPRRVRRATRCASARRRRAPPPPRPRAIPARPHR